MSESDEYILGTRDEEIARLGVQHHAWAEYAERIFKLADFKPDETLLDLGCGPGFTSFDLARVVGPGGRVIASDKSRRFLDFLTAERDRRRITQIEPILGPVETLVLPDRSLDGAYSRWLFCWLSSPQEVLERLVRALKPGAVVALQEYLDWGAMRLVPLSRAFDRVVACCMNSWAAGGVTINFAAEVPPLADAVGLEVRHFRPVARVGRVAAHEAGGGSTEWHWISGFLDNYLPGLVDKELLTTTELGAYEAERAARVREGKTRVLAPVMADVILRKP